MRKINKKKIRYVFILVCMFSLGMSVQYISAHSKVTGELEQLSNEIKLAKENNKQLEREIINLHKEIEQYKDMESSGPTDKTSTSDTMNTTESDTTH